MFITKKHLTRRTVLRGAGATLALPLLDAMIPARTALADTAAKSAPHIGFVYFPHGAVWEKWIPKSEGKIAEKIVSTYGSSVCLLHVVVEFLDRSSGRSLQIAVDGLGKPGN